jgi:hypothetical protein
MSLCLNSKEALVIAQALLEPMRVEGESAEFVYPSNPDAKSMGGGPMPSPVLTRRWIRTGRETLAGLLRSMRVLVSRLDEADLQEFVGSLRSRIATEKDAPTLERVKETLRGATSQPPFDWLTTVNP